MRIAQLSKKYGLEKRAIDYYTSLGLIPCTKEENSNYRTYGEDAEIAIKKIIILREIGFSSKKIKEALNNPSYFTESTWNEHIRMLESEKEKMSKHYNDMIHYAEELRDSQATIFNSVSIYDSLESIRIFTHLESKINRYIINTDALTELSESLPDDLSNIVNYFVIFIKSIDKKKKNFLAPNSSEVQNSLERFFQRMKTNYGILVWGLFKLVDKEIDPSTLGFNNDMLETYTLTMKAFEICADWFRDAKTIDEAKNFDMFLKSYQNRIHLFDQEIGESSYDTLSALITEVCNIPSYITCESIKKWKTQYDNRINKHQTSEITHKEDIESLKQFTDYLCQALCTYIDSEKNKF